MVQFASWLRARRTHNSGRRPQKTSTTTAQATQTATTWLLRKPQNTQQVTILAPVPTGQTPGTTTMRIIPTVHPTRNQTLLAHRSSASSSVCLSQVMNMTSTSLQPSRLTTLWLSREVVPSLASMRPAAPHTVPTPISLFHPHLPLNGLSQSRTVLSHLHQRVSPPSQQAYSLPSERTGCQQLMFQACLVNQVMPILPSLQPSHLKDVFSSRVDVRIHTL